MVLIDELGRGTSAADGYALSIAVAEHLLKIQCQSIFVTHLFEVVEHFSDAQKFKMKSILENGKLMLTYVMEEGVDDSHGIEIAQSCLIDPEIIQDAKEWEKIRRISIEDGAFSREDAEKLLVQY